MVCKLASQTFAACFIFYGLIFLDVSIVMKRTSPDNLSNWDDAPDINLLVQDKRSAKRASPAKGRRRNRRYENRLLTTQVDNWLEEES
jgi:hypothetical protein